MATLYKNLNTGKYGSGIRNNDKIYIVIKNSEETSLHRNICFYTIGGSRKTRNVLRTRY